MKYNVYMLRFPNGIHFGNGIGMSLNNTEITMRSETLFSALYSEYMRIYSDEKFLDMINSGRFLLSDLLPYSEVGEKGRQLFIPKPFIVVDRSEVKNDDNSALLRKKMKKLKYIAIDELDDYIKYMKGDKNLEFSNPDLGEKILHTRNRVADSVDSTFSRDSYSKSFDSTSLENTLGDSIGLSYDDISEVDNMAYKTELFSIEVFNFNINSGLYFIVGIDDEKFEARFNNVVNSLGETGIGGKKSVGYGRFEIVDGEPYSFDATDAEDPFEISSVSDISLIKGLFSNSSKGLLLSSLSPSLQDTKKLKAGESYYKVYRSSGFVNSAKYSTNPIKRKSLSMISSGSVLDFRPEGQIVDVNKSGTHPVYKLGIPIVMGVDIDE